MKKLNPSAYCSNTINFIDKYTKNSKGVVGMRLLEKQKPSESLSLIGASKNTREQKGGL